MARNEFHNKRRLKERIAPTQSHSNLWFGDPAQLDHLGPAIGRGMVWEQQDVTAGSPSDPCLFAGYDVRGLHLHHRREEPVRVLPEVDRHGDGQWHTLRQIEADTYELVAFTPEQKRAHGFA